MVIRLNKKTLYLDNTEIIHHRKQTMYDLISCVFFRSSAQLRVPFSWTGRMVWYVFSRMRIGKFDLANTKRAEIFRRIFLGGTALILIVPSLISALLGTTLRLIARIIQKNDFIFVQGRAAVQKCEEFSLLWWNVAGIPGGMGRDHGGLIDWEHRANAILQKIIAHQTTLVALTEVYDVSFAHDLQQKLSKRFPYLVVHAGPSVLGSPSGLFVASLIPLANVSFTSFDSSGIFLNKGFLCFLVKDPRSHHSIRMIVTHLTSSSHDHLPSSKEIRRREQQLNQIARYIEKSPAVKTVLVGDLNISAKNREREEILDRFTVPSLGEEKISHTYTNLYLKELWNKHVELSEHTLDYIREWKDPKATTKYLQIAVQRVDGIEINSDRKIALSDHWPIRAEIRVI